MVSDAEIFHANILLVDDQLVNLKLLEKMLRQAGYKSIFSVTDSREVHDLYFSNDIDLIMLDIRMPHLDGFEVMTLLRADVDDDYLPILVVTAELTSQTRERALESGAKDFITKPFDQAEVLQRVHNMLEVRLLHKQVKQHNETLEQQVAERTSQLEDSQLEIIERLGRAAQYKDNETGNHILRMSQFSQLLAKAVGLSEQEHEMILLAAPMHDIGKIGIPDKILLKPGKLDPDEWAIMQEHVTIGADLLDGIDVPVIKMAKNIALTHHERWDGSGYPNGLSGEDIPIEGRICAICDVFDALTSERPYKKAWPVNEAIAYIRSQSGSHFDPALVVLFDEILEQVLTYRAQHLD